jgi:hypothetical protein
MIVYLVTAIEDVDEQDVLVLPAGSTAELTEAEMAAMPADVHRRLTVSLARRDADPADDETPIGFEPPGERRRRRKAD